MKRMKFSWKYAVGIVLVLFLANLIIDFNSRMMDMRRLTQQEEIVVAKVTSLVQTQSSLETKIAYATSDKAVRDWAYEEQWVQPGDNPVVPVSPAEVTPEPTVQSVETQPDVENWQMWLWLFVDSRAP